jgi:hypothetical protein
MPLSPLTSEFSPKAKLLLAVVPDKFPPANEFAPVAVALEPTEMDVPFVPVH